MVPIVARAPSTLPSFISHLEITSSAVPLFSTTTHRFLVMYGPPPNIASFNIHAHTIWPFASPSIYPQSSVHQASLVWVSSPPMFMWEIKMNGISTPITFFAACGTSKSISLAHPSRPTSVPFIGRLLKEPRLKISTST